MFWDVIEEGADTNGAKTEDVTSIDQAQADDIRNRLNDLPQSRPGFLLEKLCEMHGVARVEDLRVSQIAAVQKDVLATEVRKKK